MNSRSTDESTVKTLLVLWDYDYAPDGGGYYVWKERWYANATDAINDAEYEDRRGIAVGGAVFRDGVELYAFGCTDSTSYLLR